MKNQTLIIISSILVINSLSQNNRKLSRHKPVITNNLTKENPYTITEPEISLALFGELKGKEHYYKIDSKKPFNLYVGILTPKINSDDKEPKKKVYFDFLDDKFKEIKFSNYSTGIVNDHQWWSWYEQFGRKYYWVGPQIGGNGDNPKDNFKHALENKNYTAGIYYIRVFNQENTGAYSLAVGDIEKFGPLDFFRLSGTIQKINKYWNN